MSKKKLPLVLFDVNETLLDLAPLQSKINIFLQSEKGFKIWFLTLLQHSLVENNTDSYHNFTDIADATLEMAAKSLGVSISEDERKTTLSAIKELSAYPDVKSGLQMLKDKGFPLATLTNSPPSTLQAQLQHANLTDFFDETLSIDSVKKYKPARETYEYAAKKTGKDLDDIILVAAHGWDIAGAKNAGMKAGFIAREGQSLYPLAKKPEFIGKDLLAIAHQIIEQYT